MRFLADESCDGAVVRALRAAGHDVAAVADALRGASDTRVAEMAHAEGRVVLTEDRDFGFLVFAQGKPTAGVVLMRWPVARRAELAPRVLAVVDRLGSDLGRCFVVVRPRGTRIRRSPAS